MKWLGKHKIHQARPAIERYVKRTLPAEVDFDRFINIELSAGALALGEIGDPASLPVVRKACQQILMWIEPASFWQGSSNLNGAGGRYELWIVFDGYHGMALLGAKEEALQDLHTLYEKRKGKAACPYGRSMKSCWRRLTNGRRSR